MLNVACEENGGGEGRSTEERGRQVGRGVTCSAEFYG